MSLPWRFDPLGVMGGLVPVSGTRGVFLTSGGAVVSSAMIVSGGTVGNGYPGNVMNVYNRGKAIEQTVASGGSMTVSSGGVASDTIIFNGGYLYVSGGSAFNTIVSSDGTMNVSSGGIAYDFTVYRGGTLIAQPNCITSGGVNSGSFVVSGNTYSLVTHYWVNVWGGGVTHDTTVSSGGALYLHQKSINIPFNDENATISSGGRMIIDGTSVAFATLVLSGGTLTVSSGGAALDVTSAAGAVVTVLEGGTITYKE